MNKKYIFISGGVISGIGKGITSASISLLLKNAGYKVAPIKFEGYLNIDSGTINPIEHGDPFLCEDGTETDMDIGTYEKFLNQEMGKENFVTMGQIYQTIIEKERRFEYNGEDVEAVHITEEIIRRIDLVAEKNDADVVVIELGGTAGEYWNVFYYEAARLLDFNNPGDVLHVHVSYVPTPPHLGEPKTKPTQLSVRTLNTLGIQPDIVVARTDKPLDDRRKARLAMFCNIHAEDVMSNPDVPSPYEIPVILEEQGITERILKKLHMDVRKPDLTEWKGFIENVKKPKEKTIDICIIGKYFGTGDYQLKDSYAALFDAIDHAAWAQGVEVKTHWVDAEKVEKEGPDFIGNPDGLIVPIGWGERGAEGMIAAANYAREKKIPYLGLCYGMQLAVVSFARHVLGWHDANTTENRPESSHPVIHMIESQKELLARRAYGGTMRLGGWEATVEPGSLAWELYDRFNGFIDKSRNLTSERHRHRYEFNNAYTEDFKNHGLHVTGRSVAENLGEIIELDRAQHPFYVGTQGHPEYNSRPLKPNAIFMGFIEACKNQK
jgi:CTP synthase